MCTGARVVGRDLRNAHDRGWGVDSPVLVQDAAVSMAGVLAETNIARNVELGEKGAQLLDSKDNRAIGIVRKRSLLVLRTSQHMAPLFP